MGIDPNHAETVPLVRNLKTGYLSPQYHVVFDDWFETCYSSDDQPPSNWEDMCIFNRYETVFDQGITPPQLGDEWLSPAELASKRLSKAVRQGRKLYQDLHKSKEIKEDLSYDPPSDSRPQTREPMAQTREPMAQTREPMDQKREPPLETREPLLETREFAQSNWKREPPNPLDPSVSSINSQLPSPSADSQTQPSPSPARR